MLARVPVTSKIHIKLPVLHEDQVKAWRLPGRFKAIRCGRRWGKSLLSRVVGADDAIRGKYVGFFAPVYKMMSEEFEQYREILHPIIDRASKQEGVIRIQREYGGGRIDFWSLENQHAGRSRRYHRAIIDEAAFTDNKTMLATWQQAIRPTLVDYRGSCLALSNTRGDDPTNFFWKLCNEPDLGFVEYWAPSKNNPYLPPEEIDGFERDNHPLVYAQEYMAQFVNWAGKAFFELEKLMGFDGNPVDIPAIADGVFATIDTAIKTGKENDGTGCVYWATNCRMASGVVYPLVILDYEYEQIEGDLLAQWLPTVFKKLQEFSSVCKARMGVVGTWIEDKASGTILLQHAMRNNWPVQPAPEALTALGKSERAINVSGFVYRGDVKLSARANDNVFTYKGTTRNHLREQIVGFRVGQKDPVDDDLLDCFTYGVALALGNSEGF